MVHDGQVQARCQCFWKFIKVVNLDDGIFLFVNESAVVGLQLRQTSVENTKKFRRRHLDCRSSFDFRGQNPFKIHLESRVSMMETISRSSRRLHDVVGGRKIIGKQIKLQGIERLGTTRKRSRYARLDLGLVGQHCWKCSKPWLGRRGLTATGRGSHANQGIKIPILGSMFLFFFVLTHRQKISSCAMVNAFILLRLIKL